MDTVNRDAPPVGLFNFPIKLWQQTGRFAGRGLQLTLFLKTQQRVPADHSIRDYATTY